MRHRVEEILGARYNEGVLHSLTPVEPTAKEVTDYGRHGQTNVRIDLARSPSLVIVDTAGLEPNLNFARISGHQAEAVRVFIASGNQPISRKAGLEDYSHILVEAIELRFAYNAHNKQVPYTVKMNPLW